MFNDIRLNDYTCEAMCYSAIFLFFQPKSQILLRLSHNYCCDLKQQYLLHRVGNKIFCCCLIKTDIMKMLLGSGFLFFETLWKIFVFLKNYYNDFQKSGTNGKSAHSPVYLHTSLVSLYLTPLSTAFKKVCGGGGGF